MLAGSASLALHAAVVVLAVVLIGNRVGSPPRPAIVLTPVELVAAAVGEPTTPAKGTSPMAPPAPSVRKIARAARPQVQRTQLAAPASERSLADLTISYDDPSNFVAKGPVTVDRTGSEQRGIATGMWRHSGGSVAAVDIPQPPVVSRARPPRARFDYSMLRLPNASKFAGRKIELVLTIGPSGRVRGAQLVKGVDRELDRRTIGLASAFEFEPGLDDDGVPVQARCALTIQIIEDADNIPFETARDTVHH